MCENVKKLPDNLLYFIDQAEKASFACGKCGRLARDKDLLCKPYKVSKFKENG